MNVGPSAKWRRVSLLVPVVAYMAIVFYLSAQSRPLPFIPAPFFGYDKLVHAAEYAVLGVLWTRAFRGLGMSAGRALLWAVLCSSLYGATDEWHQSFVPHRECDLWDWVSDTSGGLAGAGFQTLLLRWRKPRATICA